MAALLLGLLASMPTASHALQASRDAGIAFANFESTQGLRLLESAEPVQGRLRLTPAREQTSGAAWLTEKQPVRRGFETTFQFQLTDAGGLGEGADGFAFVLQNSGPEAIAGRGSAAGFALGDGQGDRSRPGIPNSIAVFFDTHKNDDGKDPSDNYIAICTNGRVRDMRWPPARLAVARRLPIRLKDGRVHTARIEYRPPILSVHLDGAATPLLSAAVDLATVMDREGSAYAGFTASTGAGYENHDILSWSFAARPNVQSDVSAVSSEISYLLDGCLEGRNLCTPERATVEAAGPGRYRVLLPAHLEWGASVPTPSGRRAAVSTPRGFACWDLEERGPDGCGGPDGSGKGANPGESAQAGLLAPSEPAGALVARVRDGRTYFSVNDRSGKAFRDNQGFFEFEVRVE